MTHHWQMEDRGRLIEAVDVGAGVATARRKGYGDHPWPAIVQTALRRYLSGDPTAEQAPNDGARAMAQSAWDEVLRDAKDAIRAQVADQAFVTGGLARAQEIGVEGAALPSVEFALLRERSTSGEGVRAFLATRSGTLARWERIHAAALTASADAREANTAEIGAGQRRAMELQNKGYEEVSFDLDVCTRALILHQRGETTLAKQTWLEWHKGARREWQTIAAAADSMRTPARRSTPEFGLLDGAISVTSSYAHGAWTTAAFARHLEGDSTGARNQWVSEKLDLTPAQWKHAIAVGTARGHMALVDAQAYFHHRGAEGAQPHQDLLHGLPPKEWSEYNPGGASVLSDAETAAVWRAQHSTAPVTAAWLRALKYGFVELHQGSFESSHPEARATYEVFLALACWFTDQDAAFERWRLWTTGAGEKPFNRYMWHGHVHGGAKQCWEWITEPLRAAPPRRLSGTGGYHRAVSAAPGMLPPTEPSQARRAALESLVWVRAGDERGGFSAWERAGGDYRGFQALLSIGRTDV